MSQPFRLVVFDFDGTLVDSQHTIFEAMSEAFRANGLNPPPISAVRRIVGLTLETAVARLLPNAEDRDRVHRVADTYRDAFMTLRSRPDHHEPMFPGARAALRALNQPETCLGIATGKSRRGLTISLARHELTEFFVTLQTVDDAPGKPHPEMLHRAMAEVGADPSETVFIGDTTFDMEMAVNAGVTGIGVAWGYHEADELRASGARCLVEDFADLVDRLTAAKEQGR